MEHRVTDIPAGIDFVWGEGVRLIDQQLRAAAELDGKIAQWLALTTAAAVLVFNALGGGGSAWLRLVMIELGVVLVYLVLAYAQRDFAYAPALPALVGWAESPPEKIKEAFLANIEEAYLLNLDSHSLKAFYLRWAVVATAFTGATILMLALWGTN